MKYKKCRECGTYRQNYTLEEHKSNQELINASVEQLQQEDEWSWN